MYFEWMENEMPKKELWQQNETKTSKSYGRQLNNRPELTLKLKEMLRGADSGWSSRENCFLLTSCFHTEILYISPENNIDQSRYEAAKQVPVVAGCKIVFL